MPMNFTSHPDPIAYNIQVWETVRRVPQGRVITYGQVAAMIEPPAGMAEKDYRAMSPRWVGGAMAQCPPDVPWQRVVNAQGKISVRGKSENEQRRRLEEEGVVFDDRDRIDLRRFGWSDADDEPGQPALF